MVLAQSAVMLARLLESGEIDRADRLLDRLDANNVTAVTDRLTPAALARLAGLLAAAEERLARLPGLGFVGVSRLVRHARDEDARRLLRSLPRPRAARVLMGLDRERREVLGAAVEEEPGGATRLPGAARTVDAAEEAELPRLRLVAAGED
ncbi:MAG: hypothetical protein H6745_00390 [Deltaproteobacteria bacterium]|nr:hypothetical protein [Deltaproteobacteria bacterium]